MKIINNNKFLEVKQTPIVVLLFTAMMIGYEINIINSFIANGFSTNILIGLLFTNFVIYALLKFCYETFTFKINKKNKRCCFIRKTLKGIEKNINIKTSDITCIYIDKHKHMNESPSGRIIIQYSNKEIIKLPEGYINLSKIEDIYSELTKEINPKDLEDIKDINKELTKKQETIIEISLLENKFDTTELYSEFTGDKPFDAAKKVDVILDKLKLENPEKYAHIGKSNKGCFVFVIIVFIIIRIIIWLSEK